MTPEQLERIRSYTLREKSAQGQPPARTDFTRRCSRCSACFLGLAPGRTGEHGLWCPTGVMNWWCSRECYDADHPRNPYIQPSGVAPADTTEENPT